MLEAIGLTFPNRPTDLIMFEDEGRDVYYGTNAYV